MDWNVKNAISRDVERQHLNKILAEIRAAIDVVDKKAAAVAANSSIEDTVGAMVSGNNESGISVTYDAAKKLLDFVVSRFTLTLAGDVEGTATVTGLGSMTLNTTLAADAVGLEEAPIDNHAYWRRNAEWQAVNDSLTTLATLKGTGFAAQHIDDGESTWELRTMQPPAAGFTITNPAGEAGDPTFVLSDDLAALEALASTGLAARTALNTWAQRSIATASTARITVTNGDGVAGNPTLDLATVADAGGGTLQKTAFDTYGRKTGTSSATTTDLAEGSNLYFTAARVLSTVLTGLSTATNAVITAADTVLGALGKLQAQITATSSTVSGLVIDSIADADTTHAPSRNAVFDALALKQPINSDLTAIAAIAPANDDVIQRKAGAWTNRTMAQLAVDLTGVVHTTGTESIGGAKTFTNDVVVAHTSAVLFDLISTDNVATQVRFVCSNATNRRFLGQSSPGVTESQINFGAGEMHFWGASTAVKLMHISPTSFDADEDNVKTCGTAALRWSAVYSVTPAAGDNSDKCATTAFVNNIVSSGTYTPTLFNTTNVASSTSYVATWMRIGNIVTVSGKVDIDPTAASTNTVLGISLPVASALTNESQLAGTASCAAVASLSARMLGDATNDRALLQYLNGTDIAARGWSYVYQYQVI
jgi:hypothetical protein